MLRPADSKLLPYHPKNKLEKQLVLGFYKQKTEIEMASFIRDMVTPKELREFSNRLEIARLLLEGMSYLEIAKKLHASTTTITRIARWITSGHGGFARALGK